VWAGLEKKSTQAQPKMNRTFFPIIQTFSNYFQLILSKDGFPDLKNFQINYVFEGFEIRNRF
jgi:hypothetical protein